MNKLISSSSQSFIRLLCVAVLCVFTCLTVHPLAHAQNSPDQQGMFADPQRQPSQTLGGQTFGIDTSLTTETTESYPRAELIDGSAIFGPMDIGNELTSEQPVQPVQNPTRYQAVPTQIQTPAQNQNQNQNQAQPFTPSPGSFLPADSFIGGGPTVTDSSNRRTRETSMRSANPVDEISTQDITRPSAIDDGKREVVRQRYPNGKPYILRSVAQDDTGNYYNDGVWKMFDTQGRVAVIGNYSRGVKEGVWLREHSDGNVGIFAERPFTMFQAPFRSRASFTRDKLDGTWKLSDAKERTMSEISYRQGVRHGPARWFYPDGSVMRQVNFKEGSPDGLLQQWDEQKKLAVRQEYVDGRKIVRQKAYYPNRVVSSEQIFHEPKLVLAEADDWWSAKPAPFVQQGDRIQQGLSLSRYSNGQPKMRGGYENNQRQGAFTWWHANGNKQTEGGFRDDEKTGRWTWWHESGMKKIQGVYLDDQPDGVWIWWDEAGKVVDRKTYPEEETSSAADMMSEEISTEFPSPDDGFGDDDLEFSFDESGELMLDNETDRVDEATEAGSQEPESQQPESIEMIDPAPQPDTDAADFAPTLDDDDFDAQLEGLEGMEDIIGELETGTLPDRQ